MRKLEVPTSHFCSAEGVYSLRSTIHEHSFPNFSQEDQQQAPPPDSPPRDPPIVLPPHPPRGLPDTTIAGDGGEMVLTHIVMDLKNQGFENLPLNATRGREARKGFVRGDSETWKAEGGIFGRYNPRSVTINNVFNKVT